MYSIDVFLIIGTSLTARSPTALNQSFSSHNSSFSYTPNSQPTVDEAIANKKNINIGPRNLMDVSRREAFMMKGYIEGEESGDKQRREGEESGGKRREGEESEDKERREGEESEDKERREGEGEEYGRSLASI